MKRGKGESKLGTSVFVSSVCYCTVADCLELLCCTFPPRWSGFPQTTPPHNPSLSICCLCQVPYHSHTESDEHSRLGAGVLVRKALQCLEHTVESPELVQFKWEQGKIIVWWLIDGAGQGCPLRAIYTRRLRCKNREDRSKQGPQSLWNKAREHT